MKITTENITENSKAIEFLKVFLLEDLKELDIKAATIFGSAVYQKHFDKQHSDIDVVVFSKLINREHSDYVIGILCEKANCFGDKYPVYIEDYVSPRIEFVLQTEMGVTFDISMFPMELSGVSKMKNGVLRDSIDLIVGAMFINGETIIGEFPYKEEICNTMIPFYDEDTRLKRLQVLRERIERYLRRLELSISTSGENSYFFIDKVHPYIMRWIFMNKKYYPISLEKHLEEQLSDCGISDVDIEALLLKSGSGYQEIVSNFIDTTKRLMRK